MIKQDRSGNLTAQIEDKEGTYVVYVRNPNFEGFALKWKCEGKYYYQHLMLGCRGSAESYFPAAKQLYQHLRREKITTTSFKRLAV